MWLKINYFSPYIWSWKEKTLLWFTTMLCLHFRKSNSFNFNIEAKLFRHSVKYFDYCKYFLLLLCYNHSKKNKSLKSIEKNVYFFFHEPVTIVFWSHKFYLYKTRLTRMKEMIFIHSFSDEIRTFLNKTDVLAINVFFLNGQNVFFIKKVFRHS